MRTKTAILSILATSLMSYAAVAQEEAPPPAEGTAPAAEGAPAAAPEAAPAPAPEAEAPVAAAPAPAPSGYPDEYALRPLTLSAMTFQATLPVVLNLSKNAMLKPVWIPLDLRFGVTNEFEVFVSHTYPGASPAMGGGLCLGGTSRGCEKAYNNAMLGGQYSILKASGLELAGLLALDMRRFTGPMHMGVDVGVAAKYVAGPVSVKLVPQVSIGLNKRSEENKEKLVVPLQIAVQAAQPIAVFLDTGIGGEFSHFSDRYAVPVGIGASYLAMHGLDAGLEFYLPMALAPSAVPSDVKGFNNRALMLFASWRSQ
jgi:hypothetical protein